MYHSLKVGVIGFGSIGRRHCNNLISLGVNDITLLREKSRNNDLVLKEEYSVDDFFKSRYDFVIISNPTSLHYSFLEYYIKRNQNIIIEKPLASTKEEYKNLKTAIDSYSGKGLCAYNLRFHPAIIKTKNLLNSNLIGKIYSARFFVGQYLPDWRPNVDYRESYSSKAELGGGVILDLSHEIDLAYHFFGEASSNFHSITTKLSNLEINTEDIAEVHYQTKNNSIISIHMDYLVRGYSRYYEIIGEKARIICDLSSNEIKVIGIDNNIIEFYSFEKFDRNDMYLNMLSYYINSINKNQEVSPSLIDGLYSLKFSLAMKNQIKIYE